MIGGGRRSMKIGKKAMGPGEAAKAAHEALRETPDARPGKQRRPDPGDEFADIWAHAVIAHRHLRVATWALGAFVLLLLFIVFRLSNVQAPKPIVIRVDDVGRAEALAYEAVEAAPTPTDPAAKYFLNQFLADYYGRERATVATAWPRALRFLQTDLSRAAFDAHADTIAALTAGRPEGGFEKRVEAVVLRILPTEQPPWQASADFDVVQFLPGVAPERQRWTASLQFIFLDEIPGELLAVNPLGLIVTYIHADPAAAF